MAIPATMSTTLRRDVVSAVDEIPTNNNKDVLADDEEEEHNNNNNNLQQQQQQQQPQQQNGDDHDRQEDMVMPGFRFHPTEEELVEFYLRRKVEGKRFQVELITFLDLYRYDPWELPAMAAIGEKEWYFYVPRDRKYRNGDRPNRVTTSGYWKATGADRMIRSDNNFRSIGLKKTLVFYSGKAPKGIRTSWIMNEYRLPQHETQRLHPKAEISLCRVYKRAGVVEDHHQTLPRSLQSRPSSSPYNRKQQGPVATNMHSFQTTFGGPSSSPLQLGAHHHHQYHQHQQQQQQQKMVNTSENIGEMSETEGSSSGTADISPLGGLSKQQQYTVTDTAANYSAAAAAMGSCSTTFSPTSRTLFGALAGTSSSSSSSTTSSNGVVLLDDLQRLINYQHAASAPAITRADSMMINHQQPQHQTQHYHYHQQHQVESPMLLPSQQPQQQFWPVLPQFSQSLAAVTSTSAFSDRLWEWNPIGPSDANRSSEYGGQHFK